MHTNCLFTGFYSIEIVSFSFMYGIVTFSKRVGIVMIIIPPANKVGFFLGGGGI